MTEQNENLKSTQHKQLDQIEKDIIKRKNKLEQEIEKLKELNKKSDTSKKGAGRNHWNQ